jgi:hypothetical protein
VAVAYYYSNVAVANTIGTSGGISNSATSVYCTSTPSGYPNQFPFKLRLDAGTGSEEVVKVTAGAGTSGSPWTIVRGWDGTTAVSHSQTTGTVQHGMSQEDLALSRTHENSGSGSGVHGLPTSAWASSTIAVISESVLSNSSTSVVTFSSIPQSYAHLLVMVQGRCSYTGAQYVDLACTVNGDSASRYSVFTCDINNLTGTLAGPNANQQSSQTAWNWFISMAASQAGSSVNAGGGFAFIPNYSGTTFNKQFHSLSGFGNGNGTAGVFRSRTGFYNPSSQVGITTLSIATPNGNYDTGSFFGLYGLS